VILVDVNVLVYAYRREAARHERYAEWLAGVLAGDEELSPSARLRSSGSCGS